MFAVPGWSLSSSLLKTQTAEPVAGPSQSEDKDASGASKETKSSKKRKRAKNPDVNPENLADLWESVIEGKPQPKKQKNSEKKHDKKKGTKVKSADAGENGTEDAEEAVNTTKDSEEVPPTKKEKKDKKDKKKNKESTSTEDGALTSIPDDGEKKAQSETTQQQRQAPPAPPKPAPKLTPLQASMRQKLISARFRHLNQSLYTTPSAESLSLFAQNPEMFQEYHEGFRRQVEVWPENPVDGYALQIRQRAKQRGPHRGAKPPKDAPASPVLPLPRTEGVCRIADLGCGDAALAQGLQKDLKKFKLQIHSFDLHSPSPLVTRADIAALPLADGSVDIAIFCLALMGTNWIDFIEEAFRILRWKGELWVAEIKSRFGRVGGAGKRVVEHSVGHRKKNQPNPVNKKAAKAAEEKADEADLMVHVDGGEDGKQETDVAAFVEVLRKRGFVLKSEEGAVDLSNRMFVKMGFVKGAMPVRGKGVKEKEKVEEKEKGNETWKRKTKAKFLDGEGEGEGESVEEEAKVLKPCVYKLR
ncbi:hypothetical protein CJF31_00006943 [Rutstroemia sp. NJR-2017a BVV2]|nr:hypothetical protein CJF31_00006943 [Rutstroemia sp. NJR-2017a BVV2]